jgi:hypothetical protein
MAPVRNYSNWNKRLSDEQTQIDPYKKFFFICEGANTEVWYFKKLIDLRKQLGIHPLIDLCLLEKTGEDRTLSYPSKLIEFAEAQKDNPDISFDKEHDEMIVVFDADIFEERSSNYQSVLRKAEEKRDNVAVTNPAFELFLLLHFEGSYEDDILPHAEEIIKNKKTGNQTYIYQLLHNRTGMNSKTNSAIGDLASQVEIAIQQEAKLNQDVALCHGHITSNIGKIIDEIRKSTIPHGDEER